jgi:hypothetical protein
MFPVRDRCGGYITTIIDITVVSFEFSIGDSHGKFNFEFSRVQLSSRVIEQQMARGLHSVLKC